MAVLLVLRDQVIKPVLARAAKPKRGLNQNTLPLSILCIMPFMGPCLISSGLLALPLNFIDDFFTYAFLKALKVISAPTKRMHKIK